MDLLKLKLAFATDKNTTLKLEPFFAPPISAVSNSEQLGIEMMGVGASINFYTKKELTLFFLFLLIFYCLCLMLIQQ